MDDEQEMIEEHNAETGQVTRRKATTAELAERQQLAETHWIGDMKE
jgi:hypothetical protein